MNTDSLNKHLAEKVLGLSLSINGKVYASADLITAILVKDFDPSENSEQAMMCLKQMSGFNIFHHAKSTTYDVSIRAFDHKSRMESPVENKLLTMAISLACAKATGYSECEHEWVSADNEIVSGGVVCIKCKEIRAASEATGYDK